MVLIFNNLFLCVNPFPGNWLVPMTPCEGEHSVTVAMRDTATDWRPAPLAPPPPTPAQTPCPAPAPWQLGG